MNITKCSRCNRSLIDEEQAEHECRKFTDIWAIDGRFWVGDGVQYYPVLPTSNEQPYRNTLRWNTTKMMVITNFLVIF